MFTNNLTRAGAGHSHWHIFDNSIAPVNSGGVIFCVVGVGVDRADSNAISEINNLIVSSIDNGRDIFNWCVLKGSNVNSDEAIVIAIVEKVVQQFWIARVNGG